MWVKRWENVFRMFMEAWTQMNWSITWRKVLHLKFMVWRLWKRPFCCKWQEVWLHKLKTTWESEVKSTLLCSVTQVLPSPNFWNISLTFPLEPFIQRARVVQEWVWLRLLWQTPGLKNFLSKLELWSWQTWECVALMSLIRWTSTTGRQSMKSWSSKLCQLPRPVSSQR